MQEHSGSRWRALAGLLRPDALRWIALAVLIAASSAALLGGPLVVRRIVDEATQGTTTATLTQLAIVYLVIAVAAQTMTVAVSWYATIAAWRTTNDMRLSMTRQVLGLDHEFHRRHTPGELIQRVDGDITSVSEFLGRVVPRAAGAAFLLVGMVVVLAILDWRLAIGMAAYIAVSIAVVVRSRHRAVSESSDELGAMARLYGGIEERLNAAEDLRANGAAEHVAWRFVEDSTEALASGVRRERAFMVMWWFTHMTLMSGKVIVLVVGAILVRADAITVGTAFLLFQYVLLISRPLEDVTHQLETVQKANGAMVRVIDLLAVRSSIADEGTQHAPAGALSIDCVDVDFEYDADSAADANAESKVLCRVNVHIAAGRTVGIVGRTGSGKTTFSRVILRLVEPTGGQISLGGLPIADISLAELRRRVALVPQEVELFAGTVRDNVSLFDDAVDDADVEDTLRRVGLGSLADGGIHRALGTGGAGLSAGEAQLLSLARVWLRDPDLVVLDEATARVDPVTEAKLAAAVAELIGGRTALIIAHRLSTLRSVDEIVMFDDGRVIEAGERAALVADPASRFHQLLSLALDRDVAVDAALDGLDASAGTGAWR